MIVMENQTSINLSYIMLQLIQDLLIFYITVYQNTKGWVKE